MEFNNPNFHQLADNGPNFKNNHWWSQLLTFCKTLVPCWKTMRRWSQLQSSNIGPLAVTTNIPWTVLARVQYFTKCQKLDRQWIFLKLGPLPANW
ncbi:hypothetical protein Hanom_Chr16g01521471 [Helianthus anomalus]